MKGYKFYAEMEDNRSSKSASARWGAFTRSYLENAVARGYHNNVIAVPLKNGQPLYQGSTLNMDVFSAVHGTSNSPVAGGSASRDYLRNRCVRVSEELARQLHPALFSYLEK